MEPHVTHPATVETSGEVPLAVLGKVSAVLSIVHCVTAGCSGGHRGSTVFLNKEVGFMSVSSWFTY